MSKQFFAGLPTEIDVRALVERFGVPEVGAVIGYPEVEAVIKCKHGSYRWGTVTHAWRKQLYKLHNVVFRARDGEFTALNAEERVDLGGDRVQRGFREFRKAHVLVSATDVSQLSDEMRAKADHIKSTTATAIQSARAVSRKKASVPELPAGK